MYLLEATSDKESHRNARRCNSGVEIGILLLYLEVIVHLVQVVCNKLAPEFKLS